MYNIGVKCVHIKIQGGNNYYCATAKGFVMWGVRQVRLAGSSLGIKGLEVSCFSVATCGNKVHTHTHKSKLLKAKG